MKKNVLFLILTISQIATSQSVCNPNGITTNPTAPINPLESAYTNDFDWSTTSPYYNINSFCTPNSSTLNPFQSNQLELLPLSVTKDMKPADGWEALAYNLGYDNHNIPLASRPEHTYLMLYNKYTGVLRILVKWCRNVNYNGALLTLKFAPGFQTNLLDMAFNEKALDKTHVPNPSLSTTLKFYNDNNSWGYADFKLNYDPCTCSFNESSRLALYTELISNSSVELTGKITGTITSISQGQGSSSSDGNFWKTANSLNEKMMKAHKTISGFTDNYEKIYKNLADNGVTINAIKSIGGFLNNNQFMKAGLKAIPAISEGVKFLSGLFGGGGSSIGNEPLQLAPLSVNLDVNIKGTISTQDPMHNQTIGLPGSQKQNELTGITGGQPLYNETLGIFSLINTPVMYYTEVTTQSSFLNRETVGNSGNTQYWELINKFNFTQRNYKFSGETLKYAINPASGLVLQDAELILITEYEKPSILYSKQYPSPKVINIDTDMNNGLIIDGTDRGPSVNTDEAIFQNAFKPIGINNFKNDYSFSYLYNITPVANGAQIRRLMYTPFADNKFTCYDGNLFTCSWSTSSSRPFSYSQSRATLPASWDRLSTFDFASNNSLLLLPNSITPRPEFLTPRVKNFKLKFVLNLKRTDNPNAQNVLYVVTYPVDLKPAPAGYNMSGSNYISDATAYATQTGSNPAVPTNKIIPATQADLITFCSSSSYKQNRVSSSGRMANNVKNLDKNLVVDTIPNSPKLFPVPAKESLNIIKNKCEIQSIIDFQGRIIKDFTNISNNYKSEEITIDTSNFSKGIYLLLFKDIEGNTKQIKFSIE